MAEGRGGEHPEAYGVCAYCGDVPDETRFDVEVNAWGPDDAYGYAHPSFCSRAHLTAYFAEDRLATIPTAPTSRCRFGDWSAGMILIGVLALIVIGAVTVVRWLL